MTKTSRFKTEMHSGNIESVISDAFSDISGLRDEMEEAKSNMEDHPGLSATSKFQTISDAYDVLNDNADEFSFDYSAIEDVVVEYPITSLRYKSRSGLSRSARLDNAVAMLQAASERCQEVIDELTPEEGEPSEDAQEKIDVCENLMTELDNVIGNLDDGVEFPGFYG